MYGGAVSGKAGGSFGSSGGGTTPTSQISSTMSLQVGPPWHTLKGMSFGNHYVYFIKPYRYVFMLLPHYVEVTGQGRILNNTRSACRDSLIEFNRTGRVLT